MNRFISSFWLTLLLTLVPLLVVLHLGWLQARVGLSPRPAFAIDSTQYVSDYGSSASSSHYIDYFGLFGTGDRLRQSDLLLVGSSHGVFGLSAADLAAALSEQAHRSVTVYNMCKPFADGGPFAAEVLRHQGIHDKQLVVDLYHFYGDKISPLGQSVMRSNIPAAYYQVGNVWLTYTCDWLLDPLLPRFSSQVHLSDAIRDGASDSPRPSLISPLRFLRGSSTRRWDNGDAVDLTDANQHSLFANPTSSDATPYAITHEVNLPNASVSYSTALAAMQNAQHLSPIYTLVPYYGYQDGTVPAEAVPFVPLTPDGLSFYDRAHLTAASRHTVTEELARAIFERQLLTK